MDTLFSSSDAPLGMAVAAAAVKVAVLEVIVSLLLAAAAAVTAVAATAFELLGTETMGVKTGPGVSGPEVDPPPSGSTFSLPFSGLSDSLVTKAMIRSLFFVFLRSSANKLVELIWFSWARPPLAGVERRGEACLGRGGVVGERLGRRRTGVRLPLLRFFPLGDCPLLRLGLLVGL